MTQSQVSFTAQLLSYIEPYYIDGVAKVAFYSEVNTNIKKNDKVFITNGYFDSEYYVNKGKWVKNADGYRVLYVDRCKIVLDINYNSGIYVGVTQSYQVDSYDNYIKVHNIRSQREFDYINKLQVDTYSNNRISKFGGVVSTNPLLSTNNIIYSKNIYNGTLSGVGKNNGLTISDSFWVRSNYTWVDVTNFFVNGNFQFSSDYISSGLTNNGRILIMGGDINSLKERNIYKFNNDTNIYNWEIDTIYKQPIISKLNFKKGVFRGIHNDGIYGSYKKSETWSGANGDVTWNGGFLVNANWMGGVMNSKTDTSTDASYYTTISNGKPVQSTDYSNNKGFGYNYAIDSNILGSYDTSIRNGNFINCNIGDINAVTDPVGNSIETIPGMSFSAYIYGGLYEYCNINNSYFYNSTTLDSVVKNSEFNYSKNINSQLNKSLVSYGEFSSSKSISIKSADIYSFLPNGVSATFSNIRGGMKLEISEEDYLRLDNLDKFYITKLNKNYIINNLNNDEKIILPYETLYVLDTFFDFNDECFATLKSSIENKYLVEVTYNGTLGNTFSSGISKPSIDIDLGSYMSFYKSNGVYTYLNNNVITKDTANSLFSNTNVTNSDISNGIFTNSTWNSGASVNYPSNIIRCLNDGTLDISKVSFMVGATATTSLEINLNKSADTINDGQLEVGTYLWVDSIWLSNSNGTQSISGVYKILSVSYQPQITLIITNDTIQSNSSWFTSNNTFYVEGNPNYASISKLLIDSSTINSGLFRRSLIQNSKFTNPLFNNKDNSISNSNIDQLRIVNSIFKDNKNTINAGLFHKSHFIQKSDWTWNSGIVDNSIWINQTFNDGVFNRSSWFNGVFNNGYFQNSNENQFSTIDYSYDQEYKNWKDGTFNNGIFFNSIWLGGTFNNGKFYNSEWYGGVWNNGILGDKTTPTINTLMGNIYSTLGATQTIWNNGIVENAQVGGGGVVYWYDGKFNDGVFISNGSTNLNQSIWYSGDFNGGNFTGLARWKDGSFNKGKFTSWYGWNLSSTQSTDFAWENGKFNDGQFGNASYATNSVWFDGEFNGGIFQGRIWNNGLFINGNFNGGSTFSYSQEEQFVESFTQSFYGLWVNGWVTNIRDLAITNQVIPDSNIRVTESQPAKIANMKNFLWLNGNFNHTTGTMENSIFLNGTFSNGNFNDSSFNPYINRSLFTGSYSSQKSFELNNCVWVNGTFDGGNYYISEWVDGTFKNGTMSGGVWRNGTWKYGFAKNIYWENGTWENGNWDGSPFNNTILSATNSVIPGMESEVIINVANEMRDGKIHLINAFDSIPFGQILSNPGPTSFNGWNSINTNKDLSQWTLENGKITLPNVRVVSASMSQSYISTDITNHNAYLFSINGSINTGDILKIRIGATACAVYTVLSGDTILSAISGLKSQLYPGTSPTYPSAYGTMLYNRDVNPPAQINKYCYGFYQNTYILWYLFLQTYTLNPNQFVVVFDNSSTISFSFTSGNTQLPYKASEKLIPIAINNSGPSIITDRGQNGSNYTFDYVSLTPPINGNRYYLTLTMDTGVAKTATASYTVPNTGTYSISQVYNELANTFNSYNVVYGISATSSGTLLEVNAPYSIGTIYGLVSSDSGQTTDIFLDTSSYYVIDINLTTVNGRTDFIVVVGDDVSDVISLTSSVGSSQSATYSFSKPISNDIPNNKSLSIERVLYTNPDNSKLILNSAHVYKYQSKYSDTYNNTIYQFATYSTTPFVYGTATPINLPQIGNLVYIQSGTSSKEVSLNFGNGVFKSGLWLGGVWNNGWRASYTDADYDYVICSDVSSVIDLTNHKWSITLDVASDLYDLAVGDKVSIGNIICIDVNEQRKIINNYFRITSINNDKNTLTVEISLNFRVRRIVKDSDNHLIYVTKKIWMSGIFHNGYFKGVWNYGLFKGYPYLTKMEDTHWVDGVFDGGRYVSNYYDQIQLSTGVIQNFEFRDNNIYPTADRYLYNSWIDVNYSTQSMTNLYRDNFRYNFDYGVVISDGNLRGYPTLDVLSSDSTFRNSFDSNSKSYKLGTKHTIYTDFIGDSSYFNYPINTNINPPGDAEFLTNNWLYSNNSSDYTSNTLPGYDDGVLTFDYRVETFTKNGVKGVQTNNYRYVNGADYMVQSADFSAVAGGHYFFYKGPTPSGLTDKFSNWSTTASNWSIANDILLNDPQFVNADTNSTYTSIRRAYMFDFLTFGATSTDYDGYDISGSYNNNYMSVTQSSNNGGQDFRFYAFQCFTNTTLTINASVPFSFYGNEEWHTWTDWGGYFGFKRGGPSESKLVGVVEKCNAYGMSGSALMTKLQDNNNWKYVTHTKIDADPQSNWDISGKDIGNIRWDGNPPTLVGRLLLNQNISVVEGDFIRFRVYWIDIQKSFCSVGPFGAHGHETDAPSGYNLFFGVDANINNRFMNKSMLNQGYFEIVDAQTYFKKNLNVLENSLTRDIERFRYSVVEFELSDYKGYNWSNSPSDATQQIPTIFLLNDSYSTDLPGKASVVNHTLSTGVKQEFFYNRKSLEFFFFSTSAFSAKFKRISFYEVDMIPFFRYTTEDNVNKKIQIPLYEVAPITANYSNITFDSGATQSTDFTKVDYNNLVIKHTAAAQTTTTTTSTTTTTTTAVPVYLLDVSFAGPIININSNSNTNFNFPIITTANGFTYSTSPTIHRTFRYTPGGSISGNWILEVNGHNNNGTCFIQLYCSGGFSIYQKTIPANTDISISKTVSNLVVNNRTFFLYISAVNADIYNARLRFG